MDTTIPPTLIEDDVDAVTFLVDHSDLSKTKIKDAMTKGAVWLTPTSGKQRRLRRATHQLKKGDAIAMHYSSDILETEPAQPTLIDDAGEYSVWIKPVGLMSGGTRFGDHCAIDRVVEKRLDRPTFLVHRLDRFVWGIMLLAHSKSAAANLSDQFQQRSTEKVYRALVHERVEKAHRIDTLVEDKEAISDVKPIASNKDLSLVEVQIHTGRKHQIRVHLSSIGHPIVGDRQYGSDNVDGLQLAATKLSFNKPSSGERVTFELPAEKAPTLPL